VGCSLRFDWMLRDRDRIAQDDKKTRSLLAFTESMNFITINILYDMISPE